MQYQTSALAEATAHIEKVISRCRDAGGSAIPSLTDLARQARVSHVTMLKAVHLLSDKGELYTRRGRGIFLVPDDAATPAAAPVRSPANRWQHVAAAIERDILEGEFARGSALPAAKELAERYGVSLPTLHLSLRSLADKSVLHLRRRKFVPRARSVVRDPAPTVFFAVPGLPLQVVTPREHRHEANMAAFDRACSRAGIVVRRLYCWYETAGQSAMAITPSLDECVARGWMERCMGMAIIPRGFSGPTVDQLITFARDQGKPVALLDEGGADAGLPARFPSAHLRVFLMGNGMGCGREMGQALRDLGHRRLAYIHPANSGGWSGERLAGLRRAYQGELNADIRVLSVGQMPPDIERRVQSVSERVERDVLPRIGVGHHPRMRELPGAVRDVLLKAAGGEWLGNAVKEVLGQLTGRNAVTAIVGANDAIALACLTALRDLRVRVPETVSVVGFDDTPDAATNGLTSYNFDSQAAAQAMLNHILHPLRGPRASAARKSVEIRGFISARQSTSTPAQRRHPHLQ
jgi:DNA-binding LacI/PurR family transcriptional regulator/DNA-binding FadR family transcriptional regulator